MTFAQLDSTAAREVIQAIRNLAVAEGMIVIATIHQPSLETLSLFSNVLLLADGKTCFSGNITDLEGFFDRWGKPVPKFVCFHSFPDLISASDLLLQTSPSDHAMNFLNSDFSDSRNATAQEFRDFYLSTGPPPSSNSSNIVTPFEEKSDIDDGKATPLATLFWNTVVLSERSGKNYSRNLLAYGVRAGMYGGQLQPSAISGGYLNRLR